ncbi:MAG: bifunctional DNA primase/polymerase [Acidimicrobiia bacterium]
MTAIDRGGVHAAALDYASRGWPVLPCHSVGRNGCSCGQLDCSSPGKHPRTARGLHAASTNRGQIMAWWRRWPSANVAVRTGTESGLVVIDIDPPHGGATMRARVGDYGPLPRGPVVRTGSGGWHLLFAHPGEPVQNSTGTRLGPGVDVRGDGGYVIAPPSVHANGSTYRWEVVPDDLPRLPGWMLDLLRTPQRSRSSDVHDPVRIDAATSAWARVALDREADRVRSAPNGSRNSTLNRAAFSLGQIVGSGVLDASTVERVLAESATASGLGTREAFLTIRSGVRAGLDNPRGPRTRSPNRSPTPTPETTKDVGLDVTDLL